MKIRTMYKSIGTDLCYAFRDSDGFYGLGISAEAIADDLYTLGDRNTAECIARTEGAIADLRNACGNRDGGKRSTTGKS